MGFFLRDLSSWLRWRLFDFSMWWNVDFFFLRGDWIRWFKRDFLRSLYQWLASFDYLTHFYIGLVNFECPPRVYKWLDQFNFLPYIYYWILTFEFPRRLNMFLTNFDYRTHMFTFEFQKCLNMLLSTLDYRTHIYIPLSLPSWSVSMAGILPTAFAGWLANFELPPVMYTWIFNFPILAYGYWWLVDFEIANPFRHPLWFAEDIYLIITWAAEDYLWSAPIFWIGLFAYIVSSIRSSYSGYIALGPGRQPSNAWGWLKTKIIEFIVLGLFRVDVLSKPYCDPITATWSAKLTLPERGWPPGTRPVIKGIDPLAQMTGVNSFAMKIVGRLFVFYQQKAPDLWEAHYLAGSNEFPRLKRWLDTTDDDEIFLGTMREWDDLVAEARPDGSTVMYLNPLDAEEVIRKGWGQRNPLAVMHESLLYRFFYHRILRRSTPLHHGCVIVYAPLDETEAEVIHNRILPAAAFWKEKYPDEWSIM
ncbi:hypothetical protein KVR01_000619 [Diaporthe batatas]|uniref:uncharacterized protein n=1 Tax=Diaporthe batatas TaxID=748121 RepID=UPI001D038042|nr:uncharacterized protein KVR01_000619 [Diaporthe batatas]KAG8169874.1 hypothetical protein KVR01_000619 [Diaporthe batatas]